MDSLWPRLCLNLLAVQHTHHRTSLDCFSEADRESRSPPVRGKHIKDENKRNPGHISMVYISGGIVFRECRKLEESGEMSEQKQKKGKGEVCASPTPILL